MLFVILFIYRVNLINIKIFKKKIKVILIHHFFTLSIINMYKLSIITILFENIIKTN